MDAILDSNFCPYNLSGFVTTLEANHKILRLTLTLPALLAQVFSSEATPWVDIKGAGSEEIMQVIDKCPSGALSYRKARDADTSARESIAKIKIIKNGPLLVEGNCALFDGTGKEAASSGPFALCRCGGSRNKPFCDGTHIKIGFDDTK